MSGKKHEPPVPLTSAISPTDLIAHIQAVAEQHRATFARELHDELGGLLVGASMDFAWAEQHLSDSPADAKTKLARARQSLAGAIDLKRRLIEDLRPTLLDNVGLFAALRWFIESECKRGEMACVVNLPSEELRFLPQVPIGLFRIVQESLQLLMRGGRAASGELEFLTDGPDVTIRIGVAPLPTLEAASEPDGRTLASARLSASARSLASLEHRAAALGGTIAHPHDGSSDWHITACFAADRVLAPAT